MTMQALAPPEEKRTNAELFARNGVFHVRITCGLSETLEIALHGITSEAEALKAVEFLMMSRAAVSVAG